MTKSRENGVDITSQTNLSGRLKASGVQKRRNAREEMLDGAEKDGRAYWSYALDFLQSG